MAKKRVTLTYPSELVSESVIYNLGEWFRLVTNIHRAEVTEDKAWVVLDLDGEEKDINEGLEWVKSIGINVDRPSEVEVSVQPMALRDLDAIFSIDKKVRATGLALTYADLTTEYIFEMSSDEVQPEKHPSKRKVASLIDLGFVAEVDGQVRGFILGRRTYLIERGTKIGEIMILGVHPDYGRKGIAAKLVASICQKFKTKGIRTVRIAIDLSDKDLRTFFEHIGFSSDHLLNYIKAI